MSEHGQIHADIHTLTGPYAANALSAGELRNFERHLTACSACAQETVELRETAARLAQATAIRPPQGFREQVLAKVATVRQLPPAVARSLIPLRRPNSRAWLTRLTLGAAASLTVVTVSLAMVTVQLQGRMALMQQTNGEIAAVLTASDAQMVKANATTAGTGAAVLSRSQGRMAFLAEGLPQPEKGQHYKLWLIHGDNVRSAGILSPGIGQEMKLRLIDLGDADRLAITLEPFGESAYPTTLPMLQMALSV